MTQKLKEARAYLTEDKSFKQLLDEYFEKQKKRLLNMHSSLLMAMYEYRFAHKDDYDKDFFHNQFDNTKTIVLEMLNYGVCKGEITGRNTDNIAMSIVFFIEGLSMLGTAAGVSEELIDGQIQHIKEIIFTHRLMAPVTTAFSFLKIPLSHSRFKIVYVGFFPLHYFI